MDQLRLKRGGLSLSSTRFIWHWCQRFLLEIRDRYWSSDWCYTNMPQLKDTLVLGKLFDISKIYPLKDRKRNSQDCLRGMNQMVNETTNRSTPWLKGPFICYRCGYKFDSKYKRHRKVQTGSSFGRKFRAYFRVLNLCPSCNEIQNKRDRINNALMAIVILIIAAAAGTVVLSLLLN